LPKIFEICPSPQKISNDDFHIILKLRNLEIDAASPKFSHLLKIDLGISKFKNYSIASINQYQLTIKGALISIKIEITNSRYKHILKKQIPKL